MVSVLRPFAPAVVAVGARAPLGLSALQLAMCARARRLVPTTTLVSDKRGHYIGAHRDSTADLIPGSDIVTLSLGAARVFRLRPYRGQGFVDVPLPGGAVLLLPWAVNQRFTHEVPAPRGATGRRLSITLRAFQR